MGNKAKIGGQYTRRQIKQIALKMAIKSLDDYHLENFAGKGACLNYDREVAGRIEQEILVIRSMLFRQLFRETVRVDLLRKIFNFSQWNRKKVTVQPFGDRIEMLKKIVRGENQGA